MNLTATDAKKIQKVELAVSYLGPEPRVVPVAESKETPALSKRFDIAGDGGASLKLAADLWMGQVASVRYVSVMKIEYADGSSWTAKGAESCRVEPNRVLLVEGK